MGDEWVLIGHSVGNECPLSSDTQWALCELDFRFIRFVSIIIVTAAGISLTRCSIPTDGALGLDITSGQLLCCQMAVLGQLSNQWPSKG